MVWEFEKRAIIDLHISYTSYTRSRCLKNYFFYSLFLHYQRITTYKCRPHNLCSNRTIIIKTFVSYLQITTARFRARRRVAHKHIAAAGDSSPGCYGSDPIFHSSATSISDGLERLLVLKHENVLFHPLGPAPLILLAAPATDRQGRQCPAHGPSRHVAQRYLFRWGATVCAAGQGQPCVFVHGGPGAGCEAIETLAGPQY